MKTTILSLTLLLVFSFAYSQTTKILDSAVDWTSGSKDLTVYLSDSLATAITVKMGSDFDGSNILNASYTVGSTISISDNMLVVPLTTITPGEYYVDIVITLPDASTREMQYQTVN